jgi:membrane-bound serine protease (ClpP class)
LSLIIALIITGVILLLIEMVIPGGIIGALGALCIVSAVVLGFRQSIEIGLVLMFASTTLGLLGLWAWVKFFPNSRAGREIFLDKSAKDWQGYKQSDEHLIGQSGIAHTSLRPSGTAIINDQRIDVVTQGELIEKGQTVKVVEVEGNRVVVAVS